MFKSRPRRKLKVVVKGFLQSPITYEVRQADGNWSPSLPTYQPQRWGNYDSDSCWALGTVTSLEIQLDWLWSNGMFSPDAKTFLTQYLDSSGKFSISERYLEILGGNELNGGTAEEAVQLMQKYGVIPRALLTYSTAQANACPTLAAFSTDYFAPGAVSGQMKALGQQFLNYVNIAYQRVGTMWTTPALEILSAAIKQSPLSLGVPAEAPSWNNQFVQWDGLTQMTHEVCGYMNNGYGIRDQYIPSEKELSPNFPFYSVIQLIASAIIPATINPVPQPQGEMNDSFWQACMNWFNGIFSKVPVGSS